MSTVLVTGGSGFVGCYCILQLLNEGHTVRTTVRSLKRQPEVIEMLQQGGVKSVENLSFFEADLMDDAGWDEAVKGCDYVMHVATPISIELPKDEDDVIRPAVEGTIRVLRAARDANVKRVVLTSSFAAIGYSPNLSKIPFTEKNWTDPNTEGLSAYVKSKVLAEKAAWDFMRAEGVPMELTAINPTAIFGPLLGKSLSSGHKLLKPLLDGSMKACPRIDLAIVDVRDVADLHVRAMTHPKAAGERFLGLAGDVMSLHDVGMIFRKHLGADAAKVTTKELPDWLVRFVSHFSNKAKAIVPMLGKFKEASNAKSKTVLGWNPRSSEEATIAAGQSLIKLGLHKQ